MKRDRNFDGAPWIREMTCMRGTQVATKKRTKVYYENSDRRSTKNAKPVNKRGKELAQESTVTAKGARQVLQEERED